MSVKQSFYRSIVIALLATIVHAGVVPVRVAESAAINGTELPLREVSEVSDAFRQEVLSAMETIPPVIWRHLRRTGLRVELAEFVIDAAPSLQGVHPRGWPEGMTWENTDAVHLPKQRQLVIAEKLRNRKGQVVSGTRAVGVLRHELGHAFDVIADTPEQYYSASPGFLCACELDLSRMSDACCRQLAYYRQSNASGRQEAFAEAFGILLGEGSDAKNETAFREAFPEVLEFVQCLIDQCR